MFRRLIAKPQASNSLGRAKPVCANRRPLNVASKPVNILAIETSCDDTSVAAATVSTKSDGTPTLKVAFHAKVTANNDAYAGIHPLVALHSHRANLGPLLDKALNASDVPRPDLICVTRGPGMRSNLSVGLDTAKGLAVGLNKPLIGVHHMQAHALTPRLVHAMANARDAHSSRLKPQIPFLTVLVSGGHTILLDSTALCAHGVLAETQDIALGDCIDKAARAILPSDLIKHPFGKALEDFAFPNGASGYSYQPPKRRADELERRKTKWKWSFGPPMADSKGGEKSSRRMVFSFAGLLSAVERFMSFKCDAGGHVNPDRKRSLDSISLHERREMARELQRVAFEHLASRILLHLTSQREEQKQLPEAVVVSGGVASNTYLRHVLRSILDVRGFKDIQLNFPPVELCTDNALMIAWAGYEMAVAGYKSSLDIGPIRKWSMDPTASDGGILGVGGWTQTHYALSKT